MPLPSIRSPARRAASRSAHATGRQRARPARAVLRRCMKILVCSLALAACTGDVTAPAALASPPTAPFEPAAEPTALRPGAFQVRRSTSDRAAPGDAVYEMHTTDLRSELSRIARWCWSCSRMVHTGMDTAVGWYRLAITRWSSCPAPATSSCSTTRLHSSALSIIFSGRM